MKDEKDEKNDEDTYDVIPSSPISHFDSRPLTSVTASFTLQMPTPCNFNPRPHAGATHYRNFKTVLKSYFNPRPHAGATIDASNLFVFQSISIHVPSRGRRDLCGQLQQNS